MAATAELEERPARRSSLDVLACSAAALFTLVCIEALVSILARWPYQFVGQGDPDQMLGDFLQAGTLLAPPLPMLVLFGATVLSLRRPDRVGTLANAALIFLLASMTIGYLGEALSPPSPDVPRSIQLIGGALGALLFFGTLLIALGALRERHGLRH